MLLSKRSTSADLKIPNYRFATVWVIQITALGK